MKLRKILLPVVVLLLSLGITGGLIATRPQVEPSPPTRLVPLVRVITVEPAAASLDVHAQGTVLPRTETTLISQVAGEVTSVSPAFETGAFFRRGEELVSVDARDYEVALRRARAQVAQAELQLAQQRAEAAVAVQEWGSLGDGGEPDALVLRQPQLAQASALLEAARADLDKAELDLERTRIRAPFDGRLRAKRVDLGQYLTPGTPLATIHATDYAEVRLPVPDDQLAFLELPFAYRDGDRAAPGPEVELTARFGGQVHAWQGRIVRSEGERDPKSRMLSLVARVENPYDHAPGSVAGGAQRPPLAVGLFVEARIAGRGHEGVATLPRIALRRGDGGDQVLVVDGEARLRFRAVEVLRLEGERVLIAGGLAAGEQVCVSPLDVVVDGMRVRTVEEGAAAGEGSEETRS